MYHVFLYGSLVIEERNLHLHLKDEGEGGPSIGMIPLLAFVYLLPLPNPARILAEFCDVWPDTYGLILREMALVVQSGASGRGASEYS